MCITKTHPIFNLQMPVSCPNVPDNILNPRNTWADRDSYDEKANNLAAAFTKNFEQYARSQQFRDNKCRPQRDYSSLVTFFYWMIACYY